MVLDERGAKACSSLSLRCCSSSWRSASCRWLLSSELTQACMRIDVSGLRTASDKESFVAEQILDESAQLRRSDLTVSGVRVESNAREDAFSASGISSRTALTSVSYDVSYKAPISLSGLRDGGRLSRHVACAVVDERVTEVSLA